MPSKADIFEYWKDWLDKNGFDWGEPSCWACHRWWDTKYDITNPKATWEEIRNIWNKVPLQRCHIIPRSLGGTDDPSNLFLMCHECHDRAPNTTSREAFLKWVVAQNWIKRRINEIEEEIKAFGLKESEFEETIKTVMSPEFEKWSRKSMGIHMSQAGHGPKLTPSTFIAALVEYKKSEKVN